HLLGGGRPGRGQRHRRHPCARVRAPGPHAPRHGLTRLAGSAVGLATLSTHAEVAQLVERNLAKVEVASSSLVFRSSPTNGPGRGRWPFSTAVVPGRGRP